jgi:hypothetical protein
VEQVPELATSASALERFLEAFWPSLASTALGVVLGLPVALWVNRRAMHWSERAKRKEEEGQLRLALGEVRASVDRNRSNAKKLQQAPGSLKLYNYPELDTMTWDAVRADIVNYLEDPSLRSMISRHYAQVAMLERYCEMYIRYSYEMHPSAGDTSAIRGAIQRNLQIHADKVVPRSQEILDSIDKLKIMRESNEPRAFGPSWPSNPLRGLLQSLRSFRPFG